VAQELRTGDAGRPPPPAVVRGRAPASSNNPHRGNGNCPLSGRSHTSGAGSSLIGADRARRRRYAVGQRRRLSCPTRRSSSATRCRRAAFSAWSQATVAAVSLARVCRQRATRHRGKQTRCERRPVGGRPQTAHRPGSNGVRTPPDATSGMGPGGPWPGPANLRLGGAGRQMAYSLLTRQARIACSETCSRGVPGQRSNRTPGGEPYPLRRNVGVGRLSRTIGRNAARAHPGFLAGGCPQTPESVVRTNTCRTARRVSEEHAGWSVSCSTLRFGQREAVLLGQF
jgi:hypothetical protein